MLTTKKGYHLVMKGISSNLNTEEQLRALGNLCTGLPCLPCLWRKIGGHSGVHASRHFPRNPFPRCSRSPTRFEDCTQLQYLKCRMLWLKRTLYRSDLTSPFRYSTLPDSLLDSVGIDSISLSRISRAPWTVEVSLRDFPLRNSSAFFALLFRNTLTV